jgi:hypothetical protein
MDGAVRAIVGGRHRSMLLKSLTGDTCKSSPREGLSQERDKGNLRTLMIGRSTMGFEISGLKELQKGLEDLAAETGSAEKISRPFHRLTPADDERGQVLFVMLKQIVPECVFAGGQHMWCIRGCLHHHRASRTSREATK